VVILQQMRKDPVSDRWVIIAQDRALRPGAGKKVVAQKSNDDHCPFEPGMEQETPGSRLVYEKDGRWTLRVVDNKYPALSVQEPFAEKTRGVYVSSQGYGYHEVVIESPDHEEKIWSMKPKKLDEIITAYIQRSIEISCDKNIKYIQIFKNYGRQAGATIDHPHSQIVATPTVPVSTSYELKGAERYYKDNKKCVFCDILTQEESEGERIIFQNPGFIAFEPFASRFPYETWIMPRNHSDSFLCLRDDGQSVRNLSYALKGSFELLYRLLGDFPFNLVLHTSPFCSETQRYYHWYFEIIPRLYNLAGFEWGTGYNINSIPPEKAAYELKSLK